MSAEAAEPLAQSAGHFEEWPAPPELALHFRRAWRHVNSGPAELRFAVVPDAGIDLIFIDGALRVAGPDTARLIESIAPKAEAFGLSFAPGAASAFLRLPAHELAGRRVALRDIIGRRATAFEAMIREARSASEAGSLFLERVGRFAASRPASDRLAPAIWRELFRVRDRRRLTLREVARRLDLSERSLRRRSLDYFGHAPDRLGAIARLQLFLAAVRSAPAEGLAESLAELAALAGYADQAHLTRECRRFTGLTPAMVRRGLAPGLADPFKTDAAARG